MQPVSKKFFFKFFNWKQEHVKLVVSHLNTVFYCTIIIWLTYITHLRKYTYTHMHTYTHIDTYMYICIIYYIYVYYLLYIIYIIYYIICICVCLHVCMCICVYKLIGILTKYIFQNEHFCRGRCWCICAYVYTQIHIFTRNLVYRNGHFWKMYVATIPIISFWLAGLIWEIRNCEWMCSYSKR